MTKERANDDPIGHSVKLQISQKRNSLFWDTNWFLAFSLVRQHGLVEILSYDASKFSLYDLSLVLNREAPSIDRTRKYILELVTISAVGTDNTYTGCACTSPIPTNLDITQPQRMFQMFPE